MASLHLGDSDGSTYSDSFEIDEESLASSANSGTTGDVLSQLKKTLKSSQSSKSPPQTKGILVKHASKDKPPLSGQWNTGGPREQMDFSKTVRSHMKLNDMVSTTSTSTMRSRGSEGLHLGSKFRAAAQKVQTMQSTTRRFSDSTELRDSVYNGWLAEKSVKISNERRSKEKARKEEEMKQRKKEMELSQRATKAVEEWNVSKEIKLKKEWKEKLKQAKLKKQEEEEKEQKREESKLAFEKWREKKTQELSDKHKERKKSEVEEKKKKEEEELEKTQSAKQAFNVWEQRKSEHIKEQKKKEREKVKQLKLTKQDQSLQRKKESEKVVEAWEKKKKEISRTRRTSRTDTKVHTKAWCPARSLKYEYPKDKGTEIKRTRNPSSTSDAGSLKSESTYTVSFDSSDSEADSSGDVLSIDGGDVSLRGKRKTIQVCCQVLEYWCTCEDSI